MRLFEPPSDAATSDRTATERHRAIVEGFLASGDLALWGLDGRAHVAGRNPLSGTRSGREAIGDVFGALSELSEGTFAATLDALIADGPWVVAVASVAARRGSRNLSDRWVLVFRVETDQIQEGWVFAADQPAEDRFWSPRARWPSG